MVLLHICSDEGDREGEIEKNMANRIRPFNIMLHHGLKISVPSSAVMGSTTAMIRKSYTRVNAYANVSHKCGRINYQGCSKQTSDAI